jgi:hypothetical protein
MSSADFYSVAASRSDLVHRFGPPLGSLDLQALLGSNASQIISQVQPAQESCVYYVDRAARSSQLFQLCFNPAGTLMQKVILDSAALEPSA